MEKIPNNPTFTLPEIEKEKGEIKRVFREVFGGQDAQETDNFFLRFSEAGASASMAELTEEMWSKLENTDSYGIALQDWSGVEEHAVAGHADHPRDWQLLKSQYEAGASIEAPIVLKTNGILHLVSGNTRLMVARALGITPQVLLVELNQ